MKHHRTSFPDGESNPSRPLEPSDQTLLDWARNEGEADRVIEELAACLQRRRRRRRTAAASVALGVLVAVLVPRRGMVGDRAPDTPAANAAVLRPESHTLPDGSTVELNTGAAYDLDFSGATRRVTLRKGEAHFQVVADPQRPFIVTASEVEVRAVGTAFSVELGSSSIEVLVTQGRVAVEKRKPPAVATSVVPAGPQPAGDGTYGAGRRIVVPLAPDLAAAPPDVSTLSPRELGEQLAWRVPRLEFSGTPLAEALPLFNAHGSVQLRLAEPALGRLQLSGVLRADDTESLLRLLEAEFALVAKRRGDEVLLQSAR